MKKQTILTITFITGIVIIFSTAYIGERLGNLYYGGILFGVILNITSATLFNFEIPRKHSHRKGDKNE